MAYYLYNGVRLPDINSVYTPELQESHPYAVLVERNSENSYTLAVSASPFTEQSGKVFSGGVVGDYRYIIVTNGVWGTWTSWSFSFDMPFWTNADILNQTDSSVSLAASDPVPAPKKGRLTCSTMDFSSPTIKRGDTWVQKKWNMPEGIPYPKGIWTDGTNIYSSRYSQPLTLDYEGQYVLNGDTWEPKVWNGLTEFDAKYIWTDGTNIYHSIVDKWLLEPIGHYVLNGDTWAPKTWNSVVDDFDPKYLWTDGTNIYHSGGIFVAQVLNGDTWESKAWNGKTDIEAYYIWSDGTNIYHSAAGSHYVLNGDTWEPKTFSNSPDPLFDGQNVWSDGVNVYYSSGDVGCFVLNGDTWEPKVWKGASAGGSGVWTDGTNIYSGNYVLTTSAPPEPPDPTALLQGYLVGCRIRAMRGKKPAEPDTPVEPDVPVAALVSADGYTLKDSNGIYITAKEVS